MLQKEFNTKKIDTVLLIEDLHNEVLGLECASARAAGEHPRFKARQQGERPVRRIFHQAPGNLKLKYSCQYCLANGHKEASAWVLSLQKAGCVLPLGNTKRLLMYYDVVMTTTVVNTSFSLKESVRNTITTIIAKYGQRELAMCTR
jgi:hypothetical protein